MSSLIKVANYAELQERIDALPPPAPGLVRVFRGQDQNYPLLPSGRRRVVPRADIWAHYLRRRISFVEKMAVHDDLNIELQIWTIWLQALAQHYGAGSNYLDVTHDLGIAVWFGFHKLKMAKLETVVGPPDTTGQDSIVKTSWLRLRPHSGPAYIYALDLPAWKGESLVNPGEVVDLATAPKIFHSQRIQVQSGCLAYADKNQDLAKDYLVPGMPIEMTAGFAESPYGSWTVENIFPAPAEDAWYARFLSIPFLMTPEKDGNDVHFRQLLPVMLFLSSPDSAYVADIRSRFRHLLPALVLPEAAVQEEKLVESESAAPPVGWWTSVDPEQATVIALEGPQISAHPPVENVLWNHDLLLSDWVTEVDTFDVATKEAIGSVGIENVVIEFSPLEEVEWNLGEVNGYLLRAMWILRGPNGELVAHPLLQDYPGFQTGQAGPIQLQLDPGSRRLQWRGTEITGPWEDISTFGRLGKAIVSCLVLLRDLSPIPKMAAYPSLQTGTDGDGTSVVLPVSSAPARLYQVTSSTQPRPWYMLRDQLGQPYTTAPLTTEH